MRLLWFYGLVPGELLSLETSSSIQCFNVHSGSNQTLSLFVPYEALSTRNPSYGKFKCQTQCIVAKVPESQNPHVLWIYFSEHTQSYAFLFVRGEVLPK